MNLDVLCGSHASVMSPAQPVPLSHFVDRAFNSFSCQLGDVSALSIGAVGWDLRPAWGAPVRGSGIDMDETAAKMKAACEAAERYCGLVLNRSDYRVATAHELKDAAFQWKELPRLSHDELARAGQPYRNFDPEEPIRWIRAWDALARALRWVPVALTHLYPRAWTTERFWYPISTGMAVHVDPWQAMISAIAEVVERDAIALTWLLRRPMRRIALSEADECHVRPDTLRIARRAEFRFYEATTEFGLPTVYLHRCRPHHPHAANLVTCAADTSVARALEKALREMVGVSSLLEQGRPAKSDPFECVDIEDGACYMARPERNDAFSFLDSGRRVELSELISAQPCLNNECGVFKWMLAQAARLGWDVLLCDITVDEVATAGLHCFRAVIPQAMPMTTDMRCRFLAARRLSQAMVHWSLPGSLPARINPHPQPFA